MKFKKTSAALLVATMAVAGSGYAWADEILINPTNEATEEQVESTTDATTPEEGTTKVNLNEDGTITTVYEDGTVEENTNETTEEADSTKETTTETTDKAEESKDEDSKPATEGKDSKFPEIPEGYTAGNLVALKKAYENAGNETAKAAILRNAERAIAKFEAKQAANQEVTTTEETTQVETTTETEVKVEKPASTVKEQRKAQQQEHKAERKALQQEHKAEKQALKQEQKAEKQAGKGNEK
ncbi:hypothetical protein ACIQ34_09025 [Ureibacillus sp. NPDC094379]